MTRKEQILEAADKFAGVNYDCETEADAFYHAVQKEAFVAGAEWALNNLWHDAQGDDLPEIDREVIVLCDDNFGGHEVCFGHRPDPKGYYGKNLTTGEKVRKYRYEVETYDKGEWNIPDVKWWLDVELPNMED